MRSAASIRPARLQDALKVADIQVRAWHTAYKGIVPDSVLQEITLARKKSDWEQSLTKNPSCAVVATLDEQVVGWASFGTNRDKDADRVTGEVYGMYVDPDRWRKGIGRALMRQVELELSKTFLSATLWVLEHNQAARKFYERFGFVLEPKAVAKPHWLGVNQVRYRIQWPETTR
jgi:ribosomal protein S18 acetylase RimI-like enzyme